MTSSEPVSPLLPSHQQKVPAHHQQQKEKQLIIEEGETNQTNEEEENEFANIITEGLPPDLAQIALDLANEVASLGKHLTEEDIEETSHRHDSLYREFLNAGATPNKITGEMQISLGQFHRHLRSRKLTPTERLQAIVEDSSDMTSPSNQRNSSGGNYDDDYSSRKPKRPLLLAKNHCTMAVYETEDSFLRNSNKKNNNNNQDLADRQLTAMSECYLNFNQVSALIRHHTGGPQKRLRATFLSSNHGHHQNSTASASASGSGSAGGPHHRRTRSSSQKGAAHSVSNNTSAENAESPAQSSTFINSRGNLDDEVFNESTTTFADQFSHNNNNTTHHTRTRSLSTSKKNQDHHNEEIASVSSSQQAQSQSQSHFRSTSSVAPSQQQSSVLTSGSSTSKEGVSNNNNNNNSLKSSSHVFDTATTIQTNALLKHEPSINYLPPSKEELASHASDLKKDEEKKMEVKKTNNNSSTTANKGNNSGGSVLSPSTIKHQENHEKINNDNDDYDDEEDEEEDYEDEFLDPLLHEKKIGHLSRQDKLYAKIERISQSPSRVHGGRSSDSVVPNHLLPKQQLRAKKRKEKLAAEREAYLREQQQLFYSLSPNHPNNRSTEAFPAAPTSSSPSPMAAQHQHQHQQNDAHENDNNNNEQKRVVEEEDDDDGARHHPSPEPIFTKIHQGRDEEEKQTEEDPNLENRPKMERSSVSKNNNRGPRRSILLSHQLRSEYLTEQKIKRKLSPKEEAYLKDQRYYAANPHRLHHDHTSSRDTSPAAAGARSSSRPSSPPPVIATTTTENNNNNDIHREHQQHTETKPPHPPQKVNNNAYQPPPPVKAGYGFLDVANAKLKSKIEPTHKLPDRPAFSPRSHRATPAAERYEAFLEYQRKQKQKFNITTTSEQDEEEQQEENLYDDEKNKKTNNNNNHHQNRNKSPTSAPRKTPISFQYYKWFERNNKALPPSAIEAHYCGTAFECVPRHYEEDLDRYRPTSSASMYEHEDHPEKFVNNQHYQYNVDDDGFDVEQQRCGRDKQTTSHSPTNGGRRKITPPTMLQPSRPLSARSNVSNTSSKGGLKTNHRQTSFRRRPLSGLSSRSVTTNVSSVVGSSTVSSSSAHHHRSSTSHHNNSIKYNNNNEKPFDLESYYATHHDDLPSMNLVLEQNNFVFAKIHSDGPSYIVRPDFEQRQHERREKERREFLMMMQKQQRREREEGFEVNNDDNDDGRSYYDDQEDANIEELFASRRNVTMVGGGSKRSYHHQAGGFRNVDPMARTQVRISDKTFDETVRFSPLLAASTRKQKTFDDNEDNSSKEQQQQPRKSTVSMMFVQEDGDNNNTASSYQSPLSLKSTTTTDHADTEQPRIRDDDTTVMGLAKMMRAHIATRKIQRWFRTIYYLRRDFSVRCLQRVCRGLLGRYIVANIPVFAEVHGKEHLKISRTQMFIERIQRCGRGYVHSRKNLRLQFEKEGFDRTIGRFAAQLGLRACLASTKTEKSGGDTMTKNTSNNIGENHNTNNSFWSSIENTFELTNDENASSTSHSSPPPAGRKPELVRLEYATSYYTSVERKQKKQQQHQQEEAEEASHQDQNQENDDANKDQQDGHHDISDNDDDDNNNNNNNSSGGGELAFEQTSPFFSKKRMQRNQEEYEKLLLAEENEAAKRMEAERRRNLRWHRPSRAVMPKDENPADADILSKFI